MKKPTYLIRSLLLYLILLTGCTNTSDKAATISVNTDSEYVNTFEDLHVGILFDFDYTLRDADERWVHLWVERYVDGEKEPEPLAQLSYGNSPNEVEEGQLGFGIINPTGEDTFVLLYGPDVSMGPSMIDRETKTDVSSTWNDAIGEGELALDIGETKLLAAYRETESNTIGMVDLQDKDSVNRMINQEDMVLLLKVKIEESPEI